MGRSVEDVRKAFLNDLEGVKTIDTLEALRIKYLGRKSAFQDVLRSLKDVDATLRKSIGEEANALKREIEEAIVLKERELEHARFASLAIGERIDISLPGLRPPQGHLHMTTQAIRDIEHIFERLGFTRVRHPEIDWEWYAFETLRIGKDHPARDNWETFFLDAPEHPKFGRMLLTPHTTNGDVREMERGVLPIRTMNINKTYRRQSDVNHVPMFHQFEGLLVDEGVTVTQLKGLFTHFAKEFFGASRSIRLRPHHFRFTEPSFEVDITCGVCEGGTNEKALTCRLCKEGWLELGGAGMLHPDVLHAGGIDPARYTALAFGWGVERTASMRAGINISDLRVMYRNNLRFLEQF
ncbi:phenylalanine--tRNA ligase subunit alpha [Candidatus Uhrbacteria bacterium]|nr:phenylalanine--tRNA ligase subunit alpha [Candidatus Uhrbacteria bacterium]